MNPALVVPFGTLLVTKDKKDKDRRECKGRRCCLGGGGADLIQFLAALAILYQDDLKNRINCTRTI